MPGRVALVVRGARRLAPVAIEAYRRWERLTPAEKERYRKRLRDARRKIPRRGRR
jgi:hypothetical protein